MLKSTIFQSIVLVIMFSQTCTLYINILRYNKMPMLTVNAGNYVSSTQHWNETVMSQWCVCTFSNIKVMHRFARWHTYLNTICPVMHYI